MRLCPKQEKSSFSCLALVVARGGNRRVAIPPSRGQATGDEPPAQTTSLLHMSVRFCSLQEEGHATKSVAVNSLFSRQCSFPAAGRGDRLAFGARLLFGGQRANGVVLLCVKRLIFQAFWLPRY